MFEANLSKYKKKSKHIILNNLNNDFIIGNSFLLKSKIISMIDLCKLTNRMI